MLHIYSHLGGRWRSRLRSAGLSALPPTSCQEPAACDTGVAGPGRSTSSPGDVRIYHDGAGGANNGGGVSGSGVTCAAAPPPANPTAIWPISRQGDRLGVYGHSVACQLHIAVRLHFAGHAALPPAMEATTAADTEAEAEAADTESGLRRSSLRGCLVLTDTRPPAAGAASHV